jgi:thymidylate synthase
VKYSTALEIQQKPLFGQQMPTGAALGYENTDSVKELGPVYGAQWRNFNGVDQIEWVINEIKTNPTSRRLIVSAWNPAEINKMALPPCHTLFQFSVQNDRLSCQLFQRSADLFLGSPFNIASYALLTHIIARITGYMVGEFIYTLGDAHIYHNHFDAVREQLSRTPKYFPVLKMPRFDSLAEVLRTSPDDYVLEDYDPHPTIKAPMAV